MNEKQRQLREQYVSDYMEFFQEDQKLQAEIRSTRLKIANAQQRVDEIETKRFKRFEQYLQDLQDAAETAESAEAAPTWHPASEKPETTEGWFLALTKDNLPFLTHYLNGWLPQVDKWMYIFLPRKA